MFLSFTKLTPHNLPEFEEEVFVKIKYKTTGDTRITTAKLINIDIGGYHWNFAFSGTTNSKYEVTHWSKIPEE